MKFNIEVEVRNGLCDVSFPNPEIGPGAVQSWVGFLTISEAMDKAMPSLSDLCSKMIARKRTQRLELLDKYKPYLEDNRRTCLTNELFKELLEALED